MWRAQREETRNVEVLGSARQKVGIAVVEEVGEAESRGVDGGCVDRVAGDGTGRGSDRSGVAECGDGDRRGAPDGLYFCGAYEFDEREDVVRALGEDRVVVTEGVGGGLAFVFDDARLL